VTEEGRGRHEAIAVTVAVSAGFVTVMALAAMPAPLYPLYERRLGLSLTALSCVFAAYLVGVAGTLPLGGWLADRYGRRRAIACGCAAAGAAAVLFLAAPNLGGLLVARFLTGVAVGLVSVATTVQLFDLWPPVPGAGRSVGETVGTFANLGGIGVGAVAGSFAIGLSTSPLSVPYWIYVVVLAGFGTAAARAADGRRRGSAQERASAATPRQPWPRQPWPRQELRAACLGAFTVLATLGFFSSLAPVFLASQRADVTSVLTALVVAGPFLASAVVQTGVVNVEGLPTVLGLGLLPLGLALAAASMATSQPWIFVAGAVVSGAGCGLVFRRSLRRTALLSAETDRGALTSRFLLAGYLGPIVPIMVLGLVSDLVAPLTAACLFAAGMGGCCALLLADLYRRPSRRREAARHRAHKQVTTRGTIE
jgi:MFS family permease